ncbi:unnamed protein product [Prunus brigantina]
MKLNPSKCTFGVSSGRFLGYLVNQRGIEAHPNQIKAILNMKSPATTKEIQSLTGRAAAVNRFLSRSTDKCRPFFKALKKGHKDKWDDECEVAFQNLKTYLTSPPLLSKPIPGEDLYIYLVVSDSAVSSALIREEMGAQHPKVKALLSSTPDNCHNRISFEIDPSQSRRFSATHEMGYRTQSIRPPLLAEDCYKSPSFSRFCCRVYSDSQRRKDGHEKQGKSGQHLPHRFEPT